MKNKPEVSFNAVELKTQFHDFLDRYERDVAESKIWRTDTTSRLRVHCDFIREVSPIYRTLCKALSVIAVLSLGLAATAFWTHITWK